MQFFRGKKLDDDCAICLQPMYSKKVKKLVCNHLLHTNCYDSLISSNCNKTCPVCRYDLSATSAPDAPGAPIISTIICAICKIEIELRNDDMYDIVRINECACYSHYDCIKKMKKQNTNKFCNCSQKINSRNIDLLRYSNFENAYQQIIGKIKKCKEKNCKTIGCPNRYGYCETHNPEKVSDAVFSLTLQFMIRYLRSENKKERRLFFYRVMVILESYKVNHLDTIDSAIEKLKYHL
jgi:hypothetical protein